MEKNKLMKKTKKELVKQLIENEDTFHQINNKICEREKQKDIEIRNLKDDLKMSLLKRNSLAQENSDLQWSSDAIYQLQVKIDHLVNAIKGQKSEDVFINSFSPNKTHLIVAEKITHQEAFVELIGFIDGLMKRPEVKRTDSIIDGCDR